MAQSNLQFGTLYPNTADGEYNNEVYRIQSILMKVDTSMPVVVRSVRAGGLGPVGYLDCQIAVTQLTGSGEVVQNASLTNVPYMRYQGGTNAVILDPEPGDLGIVVFCQRDISGFKNAREISPPPSKRFLSKSDGVYVGGILNKTPVQYVQFKEDGIDVISPFNITLRSPTINIIGTVNQSGGDVTMAQSLTVNQNMTVDNNMKVSGQTDMDSVGFNEHVHDETGTVTNKPRNP